jgi:hypothetical protein
MYVQMYDENEQTTTRFLGFVGNQRWDLAITTTAHFYGKSLVVNIQNNRAGIVGHDDLADDKLHLLGMMFGLTDEEEIEELADILRSQL